MFIILYPIISNAFVGKVGCQSFISIINKTGKRSSRISRRKNIQHAITGLLECIYIYIFKYIYESYVVQLIV